MASPFAAVGRMVQQLVGASGTSTPASKPKWTPKFLYDTQDIMLDAAPPTQSEEDRRIIAECRSRWESYQAGRRDFLEQRRRDRAFIKSHYSEQDLQSRQGQLDPVTNRMLPERPSPEVRLIEARSEATVSQYRSTRMGFRLKPSTAQDGGYGADAMDGLAQRDQLACNAAAEYDFALSEADLYGEGWLRVEVIKRSKVRPLREAAHPFAARKDMVLRVRAELHNDDNAHDLNDNTPDGRDGQWHIKLEQTTVANRNANFPDAKRLPAHSFDITSGGIESRDRFWYPDPTTNSALATVGEMPVTIAYYYRIAMVRSEWAFAPGMTKPIPVSEATEPELAAIATQGAKVTRYKEEETYCEEIVTDGWAILRRQRVPGGRIPYARVTSQKYVLPDRQVTNRGRVFMDRDLSAGLSYTLGDLVWKQMLGVADGYVAAVEAIRGFAEWLNPLRPYAVRRFRSIAVNPGPGGTPVQLPAPQFVSSSPDIQVHAGVISMYRDLLAAVDGQSDAQARETGTQPRSAEALDRVDKMRKESRSTVLENMKFCFGHLGEIWLDMAREIYNRVGRIEEIDDKTLADRHAPVVIGIPFTRPDDGEPQLHRELVDRPDIKEIPHPEAPPEVQATMRVYRFNPPTDATRVTTYADEVDAVGREASVSFLMDLAKLMPPEQGQMLILPMLKAARGRYPAVDDAIEALEQIIPDPTRGPRDMKKLAADLMQAQQQLQQVTQERDQLAQDAATAREVTESQERVAQLRAASAERIAEGREAGATTRQIMKDAAASDRQDDQQSADALLEGVKAGAETARAVAGAVAPSEPATSEAQQKETDQP